MTADFERTLTLQIQRILEAHNLEPLQQALSHCANKLGLQPIELAATLAFLDVATLNACQQLSTSIKPLEHLITPPAERSKRIRYRIEIGQQHQVTHDEITSVLVSESGVDIKQIGRIEIRGSYSLIDLPSGMPPDIFLLLQTAELKAQALKIKRVNMARKRPWQRHKSSLQTNTQPRESH